MTKKIVHVKHKTFETGKTNIAVPVTGTTQSEIINQATRALKYQPDVLEWRIDYYQSILDHCDYLEIVKQLRPLLKETVLLTTFRTSHEGGVSQMTDTDYFAIYRWIVENNLTDMLDIELNRDKRSVDTLISLAHHQNMPIILSNHNFQTTPSATDIFKTLNTMQKRNADIGKIAVMPRSTADVLTLLNATEKANRELQIPLITMSMGDLGKISRISGPLLGSTLSFATVDKASAPGQLTVMAVRQILATLF